MGTIPKGCMIQVCCIFIGKKIIVDKNNVFKDMCCNSDSVVYGKVNFYVLFFMKPNDVQVLKWKRPSYLSDEELDVILNSSDNDCNVEENTNKNLPDFTEYGDEYVVESGGKDEETAIQVIDVVEEQHFEENHVEIEVEPNLKNNINNLEPEDGYYNTLFSQDKDGIPSIVDLAKHEEFKQFVMKTSNIFKAEEEIEFRDSTKYFNNLDPIAVDMEWPTVNEAKNYIKTWFIMNKFTYMQNKNDSYRIRFKCTDVNCNWMLYVRKSPDGNTMTVKGLSFLEHTCEGNSNEKNQLVNTLWVANYCEDGLRNSKHSRPLDVGTTIRRKFEIYLSYWTSWNAWTICMKRIVGSYDERYFKMRILVDKLLIANPGSVIGCSSDPSTLQFVLILGLDRCLLKGKYGGVCMSIISLDWNNGLFPITTYLCRTRTYRVVGKDNFLAQLQVDHPKAKRWLEREAPETWCRSHFDTTAKCEHITNNFSESFNKWILKISDKPLHKEVQNLNMMMMTLMYERRNKAKTWDQQEVRPPPLIRLAGRPRKQRRKDEDELNGNGGERKCDKCGMFGHNKKTCKGLLAVPQSPLRRPLSRQDTHMSQRELRANIGFDTTNDEPIGTRGRSTIRGGDRSGGTGSDISSVGGRSTVIAGGRSSIGRALSAGGKSTTTQTRGD
ncbi:hypothetical protein GIB67_015193 [Kingdonia uniflora]|uniref:Transposase MuDR plant domain-containing protein n=1 Tax=Kingdonia uniflora TaxID=39325 RepID=A0A7J7MSS0_9MAGN|nr:hypothetical protein GIB67_015193 [Kingdonia uniflora]